MMIEKLEESFMNYLKSNRNLGLVSISEELNLSMFESYRNRQDHSYKNVVMAGRSSQMVVVVILSDLAAVYAAVL